MLRSPDREVEYYEFEYFPESGGVSVINNQAYPIIKGNVAAESGFSSQSYFNSLFGKVFPKVNSTKLLFNYKKN